MQRRSWRARDCFAVALQHIEVQGEEEEEEEEEDALVVVVGVVEEVERKNGRPR